MKEKIRGLWKVLFGRTTIFILLILIQGLILFGGFVVIGSKVLIANNIFGVLSVIIIIYLFNARLNTSFKLMWILLIVATPVLGVPFYIYTRLQPGTKYIVSQLEKQYLQQRNYLIPDSDTVDRLAADIGKEYGIIKYLYEEGHYPVYDNCGVEYFPLGEDKHDELLRQLQRAREFIFLEYFIIDKGEMWDSVLHILKQKAR